MRYARKVHTSNRQGVCFISMKFKVVNGFNYSNY